MIINKLYDKRDLEKDENIDIFTNIEMVAEKNDFECNHLKWFEYTSVMSHAIDFEFGEILDVGSAKSVFPYYLALRGNNVTTLDLVDEKFRKDMEDLYDVKALTLDIRKFVPGLKNNFDLITCLSVIEHIDEDTKAILNLAEYLRPGGVIVVSSDFYPKYIEYPDANRKIVKDRPEGSHTDSRVYTPEAFMERIIKPLEKAGLKRLGETDFNNVDINDPKERCVRGLYTFGLTILRRDN